MVFQMKIKVNGQNGIESNRFTRARAMIRLTSTTQRREAAYQSAIYGVSNLRIGLRIG